jgi:hypothetical protein
MVRRFLNFVERRPEITPVSTLARNHLAAIKVGVGTGSKFLPFIGLRERAQGRAGGVTLRDQTPWLSSTCRQALLILGRFVCKQLRMAKTSASWPSVNICLQNRITSGWQATRS